MIELNKIYCRDWLNNELPDKSVQLIIADPPYFEVKGDFDFIWKSFDDYLKDVKKWAKECKRLLADNGTLFWYGHAKRIAYSQIIFDNYFNIENNITIEFNRQTKKGVEEFRCFAPVSERLLMYSNEIERTGLEVIMEDFIWARNPFGIVIKKSRETQGIKRRDFANAVLNNGYKNIDSAMAQISNWELGKNIPILKDWQTIKDLLKIRKEYEDLRKEYEDLRKEYEPLRRPFNNYFKLYDVMRFDQEAHITGKFEHDTVKPETLTRALILTCSRPNDLVLVPFAGSGTECAMSVKEDRQFIGFDIEQKYADMANKRVWEIQRLPKLF